MKLDNILGSPDSLTSLDEKMGFWIHITAVTNQTLIVSGTTPVSPTNISLLNDVGGWNLIGWPSASSSPLPGALSVLGTDYTLVYAYHAAETADPWKLYDRIAPGYANDLTAMAPGWGYWIFVTADHILPVAY